MKLKIVYVMCVALCSNNYVAQLSELVSELFILVKVANCHIGMVNCMLSDAYNFGFCYKMFL